MKKLFFDIQITGHHTEYISHLIDYLEENHDVNEYYFIVHPNFSSRFPKISDKAKCIQNVVLVEIENDEFSKIQNSGLLKKSFKEYRIMHRYAMKFKVNHVCLLYFNTFQLACCFLRPSYSISGILFLQFYRMSKNTWREKVKYYRKYAITKLYTSNPRLKKIFVLNDKKTSFYLNNEFNIDIFEMLPDPIPDLSPLNGFDIYAYYNIDRKSKIFLHIGTLGERKGTFEVIGSAPLLPKDKQAEVTILLVGRVSLKETEDLIFKKIAESDKNSNVNIVWDNQFVSNELMKSLFDQCYAVLMPYKNTETSSGILGHAVAANKKVIATGGGLLKELIEENNLGLLISEVKPVLISEKILFMLSKKTLKNKKQHKFLTSRSKSKFSKQLILD